MMSFWGIQIKANSTKKAELPEDCALMLTNIAMESGKRSEFYVSIDEEPRTLMAVLDTGCPQHTLSLHVPAGATIKFTNVGDAPLSLVGCQRFVDEEEDEFDDEEFDDEDEDDEEIPSDEADEFDDEDDDEEEEEEEEEEKPKKGVKRPEPKQQQKQQPKEKKVEKKAEEKKTEKTEKKKGEGFSAARCEICKRNFNTQEALEQHNAAKHGKK